MRNIKIFDTTLRDGEQSPGCTMSIEDKVRIAKMLDEAKVDVIEAGFAASNEKDFEAIKKISKVCNNTIVTSLARCKKSDIDKAIEAIKEAKKKRIHVFIATSDIHMKDKLNMTREEVLDTIEECVSYAKEKCDDIEFSLEDATRSDWDFACKVIDKAVESGATTINIPDTVGYTIPEEFKEFLLYLKNNSRISEVDISVHCHNDLGLSTANSIAAIREGANQIECTINGIGERAGNTSLEEVVAVVDTRKNLFSATTNIDLSKIYKLSKTVEEATGSFVQHNKAIVGRNAFLHEAGIHQAGVINNRETYEIIDPKKYGINHDNIVLGIHSGRKAITSKMIKLGFDIGLYDIDKVFENIKSYFKTSSSISDKIFINIVSGCKI